MSATTWLIIAIVGFSLSGIALIAAVFMFIKLNIPAIIGDLSGKTVAREIKAIRSANMSNNSKKHDIVSLNLKNKKSSVNVNSAESGKVHTSGPDLQHKNTASKVNDSFSTETLSANVGEVNTESRNATTVMSQNIDINTQESGNSTEVLSNNATEVLSEVRQTEVLSNAANTVNAPEDNAQSTNSGTTVLSDVEVSGQDELVSVAFTVTRSVIKIHTDEVI